MRGICSSCKELRGDGQEVGIHFWENFPMCDACDKFVFLEEY